MNRIQLRQRLLVGTLLLIIAFSIASSQISSAHADKGGTGKYLKVSFELPDGAPEQDFNVTATKIKSGHFWVYMPPEQEWKLGAGNVSLQASCPEGYIFKSWELWGDSKEIIEGTNPILIKAEKYAEVRVTFVREAVTLTVNFAGSGNGIVNDGVEDHSDSYSKQYYYGAMVSLTAIESIDSSFNGWSGDLNSNEYTETITLSEDMLVTATFNLKTFTLTIHTIGEGLVTASPEQENFNWGEEVILTFTPADGYHLSSVNDNGFYVDLVGTDYTKTILITFYDDHDVTATFDPNGIAVVPEGDDITVFLSSAASLTFATVGDSGIALGTDLTGLISDQWLIWSIRTTVFIPQDGGVLIILQYNETILNSLGIDENSITGIERADFVGDVNGDGVVNGQDVSIVANANPSAPSDPNWNPFLDLTGDGLIDDEDVNLVNDHIGDNLDDASWYLLDGIGEDGQIRVDTDLNLVFGFTDHFSIFRGR